MRTTEPLLRTCKFTKLFRDELGFNEASKALGITPISIVLLCGTYLYFFGSGLA